MKNWIYLIDERRFTKDSFIVKSQTCGDGLKVPVKILREMNKRDWITCAIMINEQELEAQIFLEFRIKKIDLKSRRISWSSNRIRVVPEPNPILTVERFGSHHGFKRFDRRRFWRVVRQFASKRKNVKLRIKVNFTK